MLKSVFCIAILVFLLRDIAPQKIEIAQELFAIASECQRNGDYECAIANYKKSIMEKLDFSEAHLHLGYLLDTTIGDYDLSKYHFKEAIIWAAENHIKSVALTYLALTEKRVSSSLETLKRSLLMLQKAHEVDPLNQLALLNMGYFYAELHENERARQTYISLLAVNARHILAHLNIGNYHFHRGEFATAIKWYKHTLNVSEFNSEAQVMAYNNMGSCYRQMGALDSAMWAYREAFSRTSTSAAVNSFATHDACTNHDRSCLSNNDILSASVNTSQNGFMHGLHITAYDAWTLSNLLTMMGLMCHWHHLEVLERAMLHAVIGIGETMAAPQGSSVWDDSSEVDSYGFMLNRYAPGRLDRALAAFHCRHFQFTASHWDALTRRSLNRLLGVTSHEDRGTSLNVGTKIKTITKPPLRVAYLSYDWKDHPMGRLTSRFVTQHNRSRVESISFSYGPADNSPMRKRVETASPVFVDLGNIGVAAEAAELIASYEIDILVDLTVLTYNSRLDVPAHKPAPVVINYLGFPGPSGCSAFDYALVDPTSVPPELHSGFHERLLFLPSYTRRGGDTRGITSSSGPDVSRVYQANDMPLHVSPFCESSILPIGDYGNAAGCDLIGSTCDSRVCRMRLLTGGIRGEGPGLDADVEWGQKLRNMDRKGNDYVIICSFNANKKLEPVSFQVWMNILRRVPNALLVMLTGGRPSQQRLLAEAASAGIHIARIVFLMKTKWEDHLRRATACDIVLDTFVYGAHTTASDMLWQGVPTVAIAGWGAGRMPSRVAASLLSSLGGVARNLIAHSAIEYEDVAVRLCMSSALRQAVRANILRQGLRVDTFNKLSVQTSLEWAYEQALEALQLVRSGLTSMKVLPHIIGSSGVEPDKSNLPLELVDHAVQLLERLIATDTGEGTALDRLLGSDSDDDAILHARASIEAIRHRILASLSPVEVRERGICHLVYHGTPSSIEKCRTKNVVLPGQVQDMHGLSEKNPLPSTFYLGPSTNGIGAVKAADCDVLKMSDVFSCANPLATTTSSSCTGGDMKVDLKGLHIYTTCLTLPNRSASVEMYKYILYQHDLLDEGLWEHMNASFHVLAPHLYSQVPNWKFLQGTAAEMRHNRKFILEKLPGRFRGELTPEDRSKIMRRDGRVDVGVTGGGNTGNASPSAEAVEGYVPLDHLMSKEEQYADFASVLLSQGMALSKLNRIHEAANYIVSSVVLYAADNALLVLGSLLGDLGESDFGFDISIFATSQMHHNRRKEYSGRGDTVSSAGPPAPVDMSTGHFDSVALSSSSSLSPPPPVARALVSDGHSWFPPLRVAIYCDEYGQSWWPGWNRSFVDRLTGGGLGGSEEAVIFLAEALARVRVFRGQKPRTIVVDVYLETLSAPITVNDVNYFNISHFDIADPLDIFIAWRYVISLGVLSASNESSTRAADYRVPLRVLWLHDLLPSGVLPNNIHSLTKHLDAIAVPSRFHLEQLPVNVRDMATILPHGLDNRYVVAEAEYSRHDSVNANHIFVYARGLEIVLENWQRIREGVPNAELHIYYGVTASVQRELIGLVGAHEFKKWNSRMHVLMKQEGVVYIGMVDHATLSIGLAAAGFILYPTHFPETGCLTVMKAMAMGAIPITSRYALSALPALTEGYDMGPSGEHNKLTPEVVADPSRMEEWTAMWIGCVIEAVNWAQSDVVQSVLYRREMRREVRARYTWESAAQRVVNLLEIDYDK